MGSLVSSMGTFMEGVSEKDAFNAQRNIARDNAAVAERNAELASQAGEADASNLGLKNRAQLGAIKAGQAAGGLDVNSGSNLAVRKSQEALGLFDTMSARSNAAREAFGYKVKATQFNNEAKIAEANASNAMTKTGWKTTQSLLSGAKGAYSAGNAGEAAGADSGMMAALAF